ncbi:MAG: formate dehydrogenase subunit gamma [Beijerinckiaceae bacterium]
MTRMFSYLRYAFLALVLAGAMGAAAPSLAQQAPPANLNPTASSVKEQQLLQALKPGDSLSGRVTLPDAKSAILIQPEGQQWRDFKRGTLPKVGGIAILGMLVVLIAFYLMRGRITTPGGPARQTILRFNSFERMVHWLTAVSFILLAVSGLNVTFGRSLLLPLIGEASFGALSATMKSIHNYVAFAFMAGVILTFLIWVKDNVPGIIDIKWLKAGGGIIGNEHPPAGRFNGGQKMIFWSVVVGGAVLSISGLNLLFADEGISHLQFWSTVHGVLAMVMTAVIMAHIYIGSIGMEGAFDAMGSGEVDLNWAKHHHSLWVAQEMSKGAAAPVRMAAAE